MHEEQQTAPQRGGHERRALAGAQRRAQGLRAVGGAELCLEARYDAAHSSEPRGSASTNNSSINRYIVTSVYAYGPYGFERMDRTDQHGGGSVSEQILL